MPRYPWHQIVQNCTVWCSRTIWCMLLRGFLVRWHPSRLAPAWEHPTFTPLGEHSRSSNPGTLEVPGKGVEGIRKCGLQKPPCSIHVVNGHEMESTHYLESFADIRARNLLFLDQVGFLDQVRIPGTYRHTMMWHQIVQNSTILCISPKHADTK